MKTIRHSPVTGNYSQVLVIERIVYLSKKDDDTTLIHLDTGEILESEDSMNVIEARMNCKD